MSERWNFKDGLNEALGDRFVCGQLNETIQRKLLTEEDFTFKCAVEIAAVSIAISNSMTWRSAYGNRDE